MYLPTVEFHQTTTLSEASDLLKRFGDRARLLAGGTDLLVDLKAGRITTDHVISISRVAELKGITHKDGALRIGALTTITDLGRSKLVRERFAPIMDATRSMAVQQIRNLATVGGNLASAVPCADLPPILTALGASVEVWSSGGMRMLSLRDFFVGPRKTALRAGEVLSTVVVPPMPKAFGAAYARFGLREGNAIAVAAVAAGLRMAPDGTIEDARVVLGAVAPIPKPADSASALLVGATPTDETFAAAAAAARDEANPICDVRGSAEFRRELVEVLARRALIKALERSQEGSA